MVTSEDGKHYIQQLCLISTAGITCIVGMILHFFIVGVSVIDWLKGRPLTTADLLITAVGTSRIFFHFASLLKLFWLALWKETSTAFSITIVVIGNSSTDCNIWLSVLLSVFYGLRISNFHNVSFLYLKKFISQRVLRLIIMFVLLSIGYSSVLLIPMNTPKNSSQEDSVYSVQIIRYIVYLMWHFLPFLIYVISSFALLGFLCHHMWKMKCNKKGTSHLAAYFNTVKFIIVSFCCFALYVSIDIFGSYFLDFVGLFLVWNCVVVVHSIYLVYMTARLRSHFLKILHSMTSCVHLNKGSESRSGVQMQTISQ